MEVFFEALFANVRRTDEVPQRLSVYDLIVNATGQTANAARKTFSRMVKAFPEMSLMVRKVQIDAYATPVTTAKGAVMIINALPGKVAAKLRLEWADIIVRYLGGDLTLVQEIKHNRFVQESISDDDPLRFFGRDVEDRVLPDSVTGVQDMRQPQVYLGYAGAPEDWSDMKRSDGTPFVPRDDQLMFKFGQNDFNTGRHPTHTREYGTWQVIDSILTDNPPKVERYFKDDLRNRNELISAVHKNKTKRDMEVIAANQGEYKAIVERIREIAVKCQKTDLNMDFERELTKRLEFESRKAEAEAQARMAEANAPVRLLELQIELKRLEMSR